MLTTSKITLLVSFALCAAVVGAKTAQAEGFHFGGGSGNGGNGKNSFKINFNGNASSYNQFKNGSPFKNYGCHDNNYNDNHKHVRYLQPARTVYSQCYHPRFSGCYVFPGDTWYSISKRSYGVDFLARHIASFNGLRMNSRLVAGRLLRLPVVNSNGTLTVSNAPMPALYASQGPSIAPLHSNVATTGVAHGSTAMPVRSEPTLSRVAAGSTLMLDVESLGTETGTVRLRMASMMLPVNVIEWTTSSVKIELPKMELANPMKASLEVLRADGSLASNSGIELTPADPRLASGN